MAARLLGNALRMAQAYMVLIRRELGVASREILWELMLCAAAAVAAVYAAGLVLLTLVLAMSGVLKPWAAALIALGLTVLAMILLLFLGLRWLRLRRLGTLVRAVREDLRWLRTALLGMR